LFRTATAMCIAGLDKIVALANVCSLKLSDDGFITDSWWNPDHPTDKGVFVYEKK
jgi:hypothetical protein